MKKEYDYLVVGAGLFGTVFAERMTSIGKKCLVIDKKDHIGGHIYSKKIEGIEVHIYGAHIFHTSNKVVWDYVNKFASFNNYINSPLAIYKDEIYNLPFNMNTFSKMWGIQKPHEALEIIESQRKEFWVQEPKNLEEQAINLVGTDIYEKLIKGYTEKQWGMKTTDLPPFIIKRLPVRFTYNNNYFNDTYQGIPKSGYTDMVKNMLEGIETRLKCNYFDNKDLYDNLADKIVFTGPIDRYFNFCNGNLEYRALKFEHEVLNISNFQGNAVVNFTESKIPFTRILEHKHFDFGKQEKTIITREFPSDWKLGDDPYYPINDEKNNQLYNKYKQLSKKEQNVIFGGRLAEYKYYDMHQVIDSALSLANKESILNEE
ncbi:MAG: UDP-galactopyranose mutase [Candidatus Izimaplasma bacterium HR2]|nr:MAG: UDP-galactopyranose mutase [Candidatus Izimaplasma bacterium HR2]